MEAQKTSAKITTIGKPLVIGYNKFSAAMNMGLDEAMLNLSEKTGKTFMRFYNFDRPTIVLSNSDHPDNLKRENLKGIAVTRRESGGEPIYIDDNVFAYSITGVATLDMPGSHAFSMESKLHEFLGPLIVNALRAVVHKNCAVTFGRAFSVRVEDMPIGGHGQRIRTGHSFLNHGIIAIKRWDAEKINSVLNLRDQDYQMLKELPGIEEFAAVQDQSLDYYKVALMKAMIASFSGDAPKYVDGTDKTAIFVAARALSKTKYSNPDIIYSNDGKFPTSRFCLLWDD